MSFGIDLAKIRGAIFKILPPNAQITRLEFEGPEIAIYVRNPQFLLEQSGIISLLAKTIKKRVVIRTDPSIRRLKDEVKEIVKNILPGDVGVEDILFDDVLGEVIIKVRNHKKAQAYSNKILVETGWRPRIVRMPPMRSRIYEEIIAGYLSESDYRLKFLRELGELIHRDVVLARSGSNYVRITALGGFQEVGRSAILVETAESRVLLDFGLNPGRALASAAFPRIDLVDLDPESIDAVIVSHAHLDHCGLVPYLFKYGYNGPVYATEATRDLMILLLRDFLEITTREGKEPPFTMRDLNKVLLHTIALKYNVVTDITPDIRLTFYNAGHILGSAMVHLHIGNGFFNIVYTGDFKYARTRLLDRANEAFPRVDALIMESTYGNARQPRRDEAEGELINIVKKTIERKGKVLIPTLSVGRAQEIMLVLREAMESGKLPKIPVYIEGMIHEVTAIHTTYPDLLSKNLRQALHNNENPFDYECFKRVEGKEPRIELVESPEPAIIMATSGMLTGGPAVEYFKIMAPNPRNAIVFVSYQVEGTLGRRIKDGEREIKFVNEYGRVEVIKVKMGVYSVEGFSGHSDQLQLLDFLRNIQPKPTYIILNHGERSAIATLRDLILKNRVKLGLPRSMEVYTPRILDSLNLAMSER